MERSFALSLPASVDPKRIAATSVAIAVHLIVLMMLMLPMQTPTLPAVVEQPLVVVDKIAIVPVIVTRRPVTPIAPPRPAEAARLAPAELQPPVDTRSAPVDVYVPPVDPQTPRIDADATPPARFAQIRADQSPRPPYPPQALQRRLSGEVMLRVLVDVHGVPADVQLEHSSGSRLLDEAALRFVRARWHFIPATQDGIAVEATALVPISFVIDR